MKNYILLFIVLSIFSNAQVNRFFYDYSYIPDSNTKQVEKEVMYLDISSKGSEYYSRNAFVSDSVQTAKVAGMMKGTNMQVSPGGRAKAFVMGGAGNNNRVVKEYPGFTTYLLTSIGGDKYKVKEDKKIEWKIWPDKQKIGEYNAQKATTSFGGREWTAWFSTELPFQDGPYKFCGLPGLIVKIEDATGSHKITLAGNKKVTSAQNSPDASDPAASQILNMLGLNEKQVELTNAQFRKAWKEYANDPAKNIKQIMSNTGTGGNTRIMMNGNNASQADVLRMIEKNQKENLAKDNNQIELDLYR
jgi:GLPGLI family protein